MSRGFDQQQKPRSNFKLIFEVLSYCCQKSGLIISQCGQNSGYFAGAPGITGALVSGRSFVSDRGLGNFMCRGSGSGRGSKISLRLNTDVGCTGWGLVVGQIVGLTLI